MNFEHPLPVLNVSAEAIHIEIGSTSSGELIVKNSGGGTLKGYVTSRHRALTFSPSEWVGNAQTLQYTFDTALADGADGDFETMVYVCTNGGETAIHVTARQAQMVITARDGTVISSVREFYQYSLAQPAAARQIFTDGEFYMLLLAVGYPYMEIYENLHKDANRERAMDNFFILSGMKQKTTATLPQTSFVFDRRPYDATPVRGYITVEKSDAGFYEAPIEVENAPPWLTFSANRLLSGDFDADNRARIPFAISPAMINTRYACERVYIANHEAEIIFRRLPPLQAKLNRDSFRYDDHGVIEITNNTGVDLSVEVFCKDSFVRFNARSYLVGGRYEIPFSVKLSAFSHAGRFFRKTPFMRTSIIVKGARPGVVHRLEIPLSAGEW
ncbi:MAG: DUF5717 family protein [Defluviitaleaceae bacterium]|nr:DUF5717 family protein [Defluviitaleaceae bacterium]